MEAQTQVFCIGRFSFHIQHKGGFRFTYLQNFKSCSSHCHFSSVFTSFHHVSWSFSTFPSPPVGAAEDSQAPVAAPEPPSPEPLRRRRLSSSADFFDDAAEDLLQKNCQERGGRVSRVSVTEPVPWWREWWGNGGWMMNWTWKKGDIIKKDSATLVQ